MNEADKEAKRWFLQAEDDFRFVIWLKKEGLFFDKGCFIAQQAGEKALKACLYARGDRHIIGHSVFEMVHELSKSEKTFKLIMNEARRLDRFYIPTRYPNGLPGGAPFQAFTVDDLTEASEDLKKVMDMANKFLKKQRIQLT
jgi:HEPN domain-containing protein